MKVLGYVVGINHINCWNVDLYIEPNEHRRFSRILGNSVYSFQDDGQLLATRRYYRCYVQLNNRLTMKRLRLLILRNEGWLRFEIKGVNCRGLEVKCYERENDSLI